jgi:hypothetical protein
MRRRLDLAMTLIAEPKIIYLDERMDSTSILAGCVFCSPGIAMPASWWGAPAIGHFWMASRRVRQPISAGIPIPCSTGGAFISRCSTAWRRFGWQPDMRIWSLEACGVQIKSSVSSCTWLTNE